MEHILFVDLTGISFADTRLDDFLSAAGINATVTISDTLEGPICWEISGEHLTIHLPLIVAFIKAISTFEYLTFYTGPTP